MIVVQIIMHSTLLCFLSRKLKRENKVCFDKTKLKEAERKSGEENQGPSGGGFGHAWVRSLLLSTKHCVAVLRCSSKVLHLCLLE